MTVKWNCGRQGCYVTTSLPDWAMLQGCFPGLSKIGCVPISDIDGIGYQNHHFLWLEKKFPNGFVDGPQMRAFNGLVARGDCVIIIWCERPDGCDLSHMRVMGLGGYDPSKRLTATLQDFRAVVQTWWKAVYQPGKV